MILKFINKINVEKMVSSQIFLALTTALIFLTSIFLRSINDIGQDTGAYIEVGKKIALGGKYYDDFFEGNFPISFYFYALQYQISELFHISPIILSEIIINSLALISIYATSRILRKSTIYDNKIFYNLIIIACFLGFFLRFPSFDIKEFGTKTSFLLILFYPYLAYSFLRKINFNQSDLIWRGILMGLIPCLKPHYLILIIFIEGFRFLQTKKFQFFLELDKLVMYLIGALYLFLIIKFVPEFFTLALPLWAGIYAPYQGTTIFFNNSITILSYYIINYVFIFLIFSKIKTDYNDKILFAAFSSSLILLILENLNSLDQHAFLFGIFTIALLKYAANFFLSPKFLPSQNKFIIITLLILPAFDYKNIFYVIFNIGGLTSIWWLIAILYPFYKSKKLQEKIFSKKNIISATSYIIALAALLQLLKFERAAYFHIISNLLMFASLFNFEKKQRGNFSAFTVFLVIASISYSLYNYVNMIKPDDYHKQISNDGRKLEDAYTYYIKEYAPKKEDGFTVLSLLIFHRLPLAHYLHKDNYGQSYAIPYFMLKYPDQHNLLLSLKNHTTLFGYASITSDLIKQIKDPRNKILFVNNHPIFNDDGTRCMVSIIEYYFSDPEFKKIFLRDFRFENRILIFGKKENLGNKIIIKKKRDKFDELEDRIYELSYDFEVYVRK